MTRILIATADASAAGKLPGWAGGLAGAGHHVEVVGGSAALLKRATHEPYDIALIDIRLILDEPMDLVHFLRSSQPAAQIVTITPIEDVKEAAGTIVRGASLYLVEPVEPAHVEAIVAKAAASQETALVVRDGQTKQMEGFFGSSPSMQKLFQMVRKVAPTDATALITGESGTGKELLAQFLHRLSARAGHGFVAINCAAIPDTLLESELFGHVRGAFTGAVAEKRGLFEEADEGTAFLDEVAEMPIGIQAKMLRFLQDRTVRRVGGVTTHRVNVRIIAATNRDLSIEVAAGRFREDLFYRLNVVRLHLAPLRERRETIPFLTSHILARLCTRYGKEIHSLSADTQKLLLGYPYPGNIRELENILEHGIIMADGPRIEVAHLPPSVTEPRAPLLAATSTPIAAARGAAAPDAAARAGAAPLSGTGAGPTQGPGAEPATDRAAGASGRTMTLEEVERAYVEEVLRACAGNQSLAARRLGISRTSLWRRLKQPAGKSS